VDPTGLLKLAQDVGGEHVACNPPEMPTPLRGRPHPTESWDSGRGTQTVGPGSFRKLAVHADPGVLACETGPVAPAFVEPLTPQP
jgi:hypothetical protein